jgi:hypothetical protein
MAVSHQIPRSLLVLATAPGWKLPLNRHRTVSAILRWRSWAAGLRLRRMIVHCGSLASASAPAPHDKVEFRRRPAGVTAVSSISFDRIPVIRAANIKVQ